MKFAISVQCQLSAGHFETLIGQITDHFSTQGELQVLLFLFRCPLMVDIHVTNS